MTLIEWLALAAGVALYGLLTVTGILALLHGTPGLLGLLQAGGAMYLLYLALRILRSDGGAVQAAAPRRGSLFGAARDGFAIAFLNPKLALFMLALFSQFVEPGFGVGELAVMVMTVGLIDGAWYSLVVALLARPRWLEALRARGAAVDRLFALLLIGLALALLLDVLLAMPLFQ